MNLEQMILLGKLYKMYKGRDYEFSTLKNNEIFLSYPSTFNDPFDCFISIVKEEFEREFLKLKLPNDKYSEIKKYVNEVSFEWMRFFEHEKYLTPIRPFPACPPTIESPETDRLENECWGLYEEYYKELIRIRDQYGIVCFTKNKPENNMVMWAHYADNYHGFCGEYVFSNPSDLCSEQRRDKKLYNLLLNMGKVRYRNKIISVDCEKLLKIPVKDLSVNPYIEKYIKTIMFTKNIQWGYEKEYRLVLKKDDCKITNENNNGFSISFPYLQKIFIKRDEKQFSRNCAVDLLAKELHIDRDYLVQSNEWIELETDEETTIRNMINIHKQYKTPINVEDIPF